MNAREAELTARTLLADQDLIGVYLKEKRWAELAALARYAAQDAPLALAQTDPALYTTLREQITKFRINGGGLLNPERLEGMAEK